MLWWTVVAVSWTLSGASLLSLDDERRASIDLELWEWDLEAEDNGCDNYQTALWTFLTAKATDSEQRVEAIVGSANLQKDVAQKCKPFLAQEFRRPELSRRAQLMGNPGAALLPESDVKKGAEFTSAAEQRQRFVSNYSLAFAYIQNESRLEELWSEWQEKLKPPDDEDAYADFLSSAQQTASLNRQRNLEQLWEMQSDWKDGYSKASKLWAQIEPLYLKFHAFVRRRLQKIYPEVPDPIPIHLLGSPEGVDWSSLARVTLLQEEIVKGLESSISQQSTKELYRNAQKMSMALDLPDLGRSFWDASKFDGQCPSKIVSACSDEGVRVVTCNATLGWADYLDAHEKIFRGSYYNLAARTNSYIFRHGNRFSGVEEAVSGLGSLLATANAIDAGLLSRDASDPSSQAVNLRMLVALKTLPRLAYLLGADQCRIRDAPSPSRPLPNSCWDLRSKMQRVAKPASLESEPVFDLLSDSAVTSNAPHLSEFAGAILQFQLYEYLAQTSGLSRRDLFQIGIGKLQVNDDFRRLLMAGLSSPWPDLLQEINITEVSAGPLLKFFRPLLPIWDDMAPVSAIPDYDFETEFPPIVEASSAPPPVTRGSRIASARPEVTSGFSVTTSSELEPEVSTESDLSEGEGGGGFHKSTTTWVAVGGILLGVVIVVAAIFIVNRKRKSQPEMRNGHGAYDANYEPVVRRSVGRPASFSPVVAKRLSENGNGPPLPLLTSFSETPSPQSPETIILEETFDKN